MNRRPLLALLLALAALGPSALLATAAHAEDGDDDPTDGGDDSSNEDSGDDDDNSGDDNSSDDGGEGEGDSKDTGAGTRVGSETNEDDHDEALRAVTAKDAIPLNQMLRHFARQFDGTIVDITLIKNTDSLRYRVKFIDPAGRVRRAFFDAVTGAHVR